MILNSAFTSYHITPAALLNLTAAIGLALLGLTILLWERRSRVSQAFLLMIIPVSLTLFSYGWLYQATEERAGLAWAQVAVLSNLFIPPTVYYYITQIVDGVYRDRRVGRAFWLLSLGLAVSSLITDDFLLGLHRYPWGYFPRLGRLSALYFLFFALIAGISFRHLWRHYRSAIGAQKIAYRWFLIAFGVGLLALCDYLAMFGTPLPPIGFLPAAVSMTLIARTMRRARQAYLTPAFAADQIVETMADPLLVCDQDGFIRVVNPALCDVFGYYPEEIVGQPLDRIFPDGQQVPERSEELPWRGPIRNHEMALLAKSGQSVDVSVSSTPVKDPSGVNVGAVVIARDIRQRKRADDILRRAHDQLERRVQDRTAELIQTNDQLQREIAYRNQVELALRESEERYALATRGANDGLWDWDLRSNGMYYSPRWKSMLLYEDHDLSDSPEEWFSRVHPADLEQLKIDITAHLKGLAPHFESEHRIRHKDGTYRWMLTRGIAVRGVGGKAYRIAGSQTDITDRKRAEEQLLHDAFHDALTGLPNRALFMDRLGRVIERTKRSKDRLFSVLFLDLDRFKLVNDSLGHTVGDRLLIALAQRLEVCLRSADTIARLGGDEFVILLEDIDSIQEATQVADRVQKELQLPFKIDEHEVFITASIGIVSNADGCERPEDILRDADIAMYGAKANGKARHVLFDETMRARSVNLLQVETDLHRALERDELRVHYQPIMDLRSGSLTGFEALVRWKHPERGLIPPAEFIPIAEETGLISVISQVVMLEACRQLSAWQEQFPPVRNLTMGVNISSKQFAQPDLIHQVKESLDEAGLEAERLSLEITESAIIENLDVAQEMLSQLHNLGVKVQMDDFGTGYSSLSYLHRFPIDAIKIDRSFISELGPKGNYSGIVTTMVNLAHDMGIDVIAEGIETDLQLEMLLALDCKFGQGFYFSHPLNAAAAGKYLTTATILSELEIVST